MAARKKVSQINLLPQEEFAASTTGRILAWLLSTFRYLVITTEMIVIGAFLSRFYFDSRVADLNEEIDQKKDYIEAFLPFERDYKLIQQKLAIVSELSDDKQKMSPLLESVVAQLPVDVQLITLSFADRNKVDIQASSLSEKSIQQFIVNLDQGTLENVVLSQMDSKANTPFINFAVQATLPGSKSAEEIMAEQTEGVQ